MSEGLGIEAEYRFVYLVEQLACSPFVEVEKLEYLFDQSPDLFALPIAGNAVASETLLDMVVEFTLKDLANLEAEENHDYDDVLFLTNIFEALMANPSYPKDKAMNLHEKIKHFTTPLAILRRDDLEAEDLSKLCINELLLIKILNHPNLTSEAFEYLILEGKVPFYLIESLSTNVQPQNIEKLYRGITEKAVRYYAQSFNHFRERLFFLALPTCPIDVFMGSLAADLTIVECLEHFPKMRQKVYTYLKEQGYDNANEMPIEWIKLLIVAQVEVSVQGG